MSDINEQPKKKKPKKILSTILVMLISGGLGAFAGIAGIDAAKTMTASQVITIAILLIPAFMMVIAIHEGGHALAGTWVNFDFRMYVVGPFMWDKEPAGWKFKLNKNVNLFGGLAMCLPKDSENLARRFSMFALGGPIASLVFAALAFGMKQWVSNDVLHSLFTVLAYLSFFIFVVTIIPMHTGGFYTDGARVIRLLKGGDTGRFELLLLNAVTSASAGIRPRDMNKADLNEAVELGNKLNAPMTVYLHLYLHQAALDEGDADEAEQHLDDYLANIENIPDGLRGMAHLDAAFFHAYARKNLAQAEQYWKQFVPSAMIPKAQVLATEAAIGKLKGDPGANAKIEQALIEIPKMIDRGNSIALKEKLMTLKEA
jgi:hypothetical protein